MPFPSLSRRQWLQTAGAAAVAGLAGDTVNPCAAIEPIQRTGTPKFKFSLAAYSYRDLLTGKTKLPDSTLANFTLTNFIDDCAKFQLEGTELTGYYFPSPLTPDYLLKLKAQCFRLGLTVSGTAVGNDFCFPDGPERDKQIASVKQWIDHAAILGAPIIRIFSGNVKKEQTPVEARKQAISAIEECCDYAGKKAVFLALENHGGLTATPTEMLELVKGVKSPWFAVNLDSGNFHGDDVYADLEKIAPYAMNVQIKVVVSSSGKKKQPSDYPRLAKMLRNVGYRGFIVLEFEENEDPRTACPKYLEEIRKAFA